jgi:NADH dehydrogenase
MACSQIVGNAPVQVVVVDRNNYHTFSPCSIVTAPEADSIAYPIQKIFAGQKNLSSTAWPTQQVHPARNTNDQCGRYPLRLSAALATASLTTFSAWKASSATP